MRRVSIPTTTKKLPAGLRILLLLLVAELALSVFSSSAFAEKVSWYGNESICWQWGGHTRNGEMFNENAYTCASPYKSDLGKFFKVTYKGKSIIVRCNDTGSFKKYGRRLDLSKFAFKSLSSLSDGVISVSICLWGESATATKKMVKNDHFKKGGYNERRRNKK